LLVAALTAFVTDDAPSQVTPHVAPPALSVRAGDVQLYHVDVRYIKRLRSRDVVVDCGARNVRDDDIALLFQRREVILDEAVNADVLKSHGIQYAGGSLSYSRRNVSHLRHDGHSLAGDTAEPGQRVQVGEALAVAVGSGSGDHRVRELYPRDFYGKISH